MNDHVRPAFATEVAFTLPKGYVDGGGVLHRKGVMRLATAADYFQQAIDRGLRIAAGLALIALAATGTVGAWGFIGLVPLATGLIGWCPPYAILGISTCKMRS